MALRLRENEARIQFGKYFVPGQVTFTLLSGEGYLVSLNTATTNIADMPSSSCPERSAVTSTTYEVITQGRQSPRRDENARSEPRREGARPLYSSNIHLTDQGLVEMRQARALAGLDTGELDIEITRRILHDPRAWGWVGTALAARGWVDDYEAAHRMHRVEREQYPRYLWTQHSRYATALRGRSARIVALLDLMQ